MAELDAWGGLAVPCGGANANAECASKFAGDGSRGRAGYCMGLPAGAVGGAVPADGAYCACAKFRSGPDCDSLGLGAYAFAAAQGALALIYAWIIVYALRTRRALVATGTQRPATLKVLALLVASAACLISAFTCQILMAVAPVPFFSAWSAFDVTSSAAVGLVIAAAGTLAVQFRVVARHAERRRASAWEARAANVFSVVSFASILAAPTSKTSKRWSFWGSARS